MGSRLAEAAEHDRLEMGEAGVLPGQPVESRPVHVAHGFVPRIADAGPAGEVAARGGFDIEAVQAVDVGQDLDASPVGDDLEAGAGGEAKPFLEFRRDDELVFLDAELVDVPGRGFSADGEALLALLEIGQEPRPLGHAQGELFLTHGINI